MVMKRHSYKKNYNIKNKRKSKINGGRPPAADNEQCRLITTLGWENDGHRSRVISVAFHPELPLLATGSDDNTAKLWRFSADGSTTICVATMEGRHGHTGAVTSVAFHSKLPLLATGSKDRTAKLWRFSANGLLVTCVATLEGKHGHRNWINSVAFHPTLPFLATGSDDMTAKLWSFNPLGSEATNMSATCVATLEGEHGHRSYVYSVAFHPKLPLLATGSKDRTAKLWRFDLDGLARGDMSETCVATLGGWERPNGHRNSVTSVEFHPTLPLLASGSTDTTAKLWRFDPSGLEIDNISTECVATLQTQSDPENIVTSVAFHPTLPILVIGSHDRTAKLWSYNPHGSEKDNMSAKCVEILYGHVGIVMSVAFHPTLPFLATGSLDYNAKLWCCKKLISTYNDFTLYRKKGDISEDICNCLCYLCNFKLCKKNSSNDKNSNGYVVKLTNGDLTKDIHVHYNCLHFQLTTNKTEIDNIPILTDTIQRILNIDGKEDALIGNNFHN
jgi:WD40 repeat protein